MENSEIENHNFQTYASLLVRVLSRLYSSIDSAEEARIDVKKKIKINVRY